MPDVSNISHEVDNWESYWISIPECSLPTTISETLQKTNPISFPNISTALRLLAVLLFTSCSCERSASVIGLLKTYTQSNMRQDHLNGLATLYTDKSINVSIEESINTFAQKHTRRLSLLNLLASDEHFQKYDDAISSEVY